MNSATVFFMDETGSARIKNLTYNRVFKTEQPDTTKTSFTIGNKVKISAQDNTGIYKSTKGTIIGMNKDNAMVETSPGYVNLVPYNKIVKL